MLTPIQRLKLDSDVGTDSNVDAGSDVITDSEVDADSDVDTLTQMLIRIRTLRLIPMLMPIQK